MKYTKKLLSLIMVMAMVLTMMGSALAVDINIDDSGDATYNAYKLLDLKTVLNCTDPDTHTNGVAHDDDCYGYDYTLNDKYDEVMETYAVTEDPLNPKTLNQRVVEGLGTYSGRDLADSLYAKLKTADLLANPDTTLKSGANDGGLTEQGYWLIVDVTELSKEDEDDDGHVRSLVILDTAGQEAIDVTKKDDKIPFDKLINSADHDVTADFNQEVTFTLKSKLPTNLKEYSSYTFVFEDTMSDGLNFKEIVSVQIDGVDATYTATGFANGTGVNGDATFDVSEYVTDNLTTLGGKDVIITYTATVNSSAKVDGTAEKNTAFVTYSNDYQNTSEGKTVEDTVEVYTYNLKAYKFAMIEDVKTGLSNAEFKIINTDDKVAVVTETGTPGTYNFVKWVNENNLAEGESIVVKSPDSGEMIINGLKVGTYKLKETTAPTGYTLLAEAEDMAITAITTTDEVTKVTDLSDFSTEKIEIENKSGSVLPATGGMGTTLFYALGGILAIGAAILLITKKRMHNTED